VTTPVVKAVAFVTVSEEMAEDMRGFLDRFAQSMAADAASKDERYSNVHRRGYNAGADAAFAALVRFVNDGGRVGLPMGPASLHIVDGEGRSFEIASLLALRPWPGALR
jgi:hypothetical protein